MIFAAATTSKTCAVTAASAAAAAFRIPGGGGGLGIGTIIVLGLIGWALGIDPRILIGGAEILTGGGAGQPQIERQAPPQRSRATPADQQGQFVAAVLGVTEDVWTEIFRAERPDLPGAAAAAVRGRRRDRPCGMAQSAMGPFYCPPDRRMFLDTSFFRDMEQQIPRLHRQGMRICAGLCDRA